MKTSILEKALFAAIAIVLLYVMVSFAKIHVQQQNCLSALVADLLGGKIIASQVACSGAIK